MGKSLIQPPIKINFYYGMYVSVYVLFMVVDTHNSRNLSD